MTNAIEQTKREMYDDLKRFGSMVGSTHLFKTFQDSLEAYLEALRCESVIQQAKRQDALDSGSAALDRLRQMTEERDQVQQRLHAIDHAYNEQSARVSRQMIEIDRHKVALNIAGEELIRVQGIARQYLDDCRGAEKLSDDLDEKLRDAQAVIGHQEQLIVGQRLAIADLYMASSKPRRRTLSQIKEDIVKSGCKTCEGLGYIHCNGGRPTAPCPEGCQ